jgi:hypothetical protein
MLHGLSWNVDSCSAGQEMLYFYKTWKFIPVLTKVCHYIICRASWMQSTPSHTILLRHISVISAHLHQGLSHGPFLTLYYQILNNFLPKNKIITCLVSCSSSWGSSVSIVCDYRLDKWGSIPSRGKGFFLYPLVSRPAVRPTQPPIQWLPGVLSLV